jgi:hypothetical protein
LLPSAAGKAAARGDIAALRLHSARTVSFVEEVSQAMTARRFVLLLVVLSLTAIPARSLSAGGAAPATTPAGETALSNKDVIKLVKLDLGDDVVIAKIKQADSVDFDVTTDGLIQLKQASVSGRVIAAMLEKTTPANERPVVPFPGRMPGGRSVDSLGQDIRILAGGKEIVLDGNQGDLTTTGMWPVVMVYLDYPGLHARVRTSETRPALLVRSSHDPTAYYYIGKLDANQNDNNRSLKIEQKASGFSATTRVIPAGHWQVEYDASEASPGVWRIVPKRDLQPGEYGVVIPGGTLYEFGVD